MKPTTIMFAIALAAFACSKEQAQHPVTTAKAKVAKALDDITTPIAGPDETPQQREKERFDAQWRQLQSFREQQAQKAAAIQQRQQQAAAQQIQFAADGKESFKGLDANAINAAPLHAPITGDMSGPSVLKAQVWLDRTHFSVGVIDGRWGRNSAVTVFMYQRARGIQATGDLDEATFRTLASEAGAAPPIVPYRVTADDLKGPFVTIPDDVYEQQKLDCLCYQSLREELSEKFHTTEDFLEQINPDVKFSDLKEGDTINALNVRPPTTADTHDIVKIVISIRGNSFNGYNAAGQIVFHGPTTLGSGYDPSPTETLHIVKIIPMPHFHYDPTLYHEVPDWKPDAHLNPGPNSPVGIVWMALSKEHYGIHGTKDPDQIGYASSHGCVRLTNWDAEEVEHRAFEGTVVSFVDTQHS
jgi:lipoprotein-anchoring transpeptidase ErfK/SrfK